MNNDTTLLDALRRSEIYRDYERAYSDTTRLPIALCGDETWQPPFRGKARENSFCALMGTQNASCAACLRMQEKIASAATDRVVTAKCHFGLTEAAVPLKLGQKTIGFLRTGQVFTQQPDAAQFRKAAATMRRMGLNLDPGKVREAYMATRVMPHNQLLSATRLLRIFAEHLVMKANQIAVHQANIEPLAVVRAKEYIRQHLHEDITLADTAKAACVSSFTICKLFRRHTGATFTEHVSRLRIEKATELLLNPRLRISEIAFKSGFQSLTHFNRIFRKLVGESPTLYREKLVLPLAA